MLAWTSFWKNANDLRSHDDLAPVIQIHDDVNKWKHFPRYCPFVREFTGHQWNPCTKSSDAELWCLMFGLWSLMYAWINGWVNNREAGDWRRHRAYYDAIVNLKPSPCEVRVIPDKRGQYHCCWCHGSRNLQASSSNGITDVMWCTYCLCVLGGYRHWAAGKDRQIPHHVHGYDYVIKWKHFPRYWPFVRGIHRSPANYPHKGQWHGVVMLSLVCAWIHGWVNNRDAGDLGRHLAHYDIIVMLCIRQAKRNTSTRLTWATHARQVPDRFLRACWPNPESSNH